MNMFGGLTAQPFRVLERKPLTMFRCGPSKCDHDYRGWVEYRNPDGSIVGTTVCAKCGASAFDEARWF